MIEAYPLYWPLGRKRSQHAQHSKLSSSLAKARDAVTKEVRLLGGSQLIISTNISLRKDGLPHASAREPSDPGVAVYFTYKGRQVCFACDRWWRTASNMQAIAKTIDALRGVARWGTGDMMESAFSGFTALPDPESVSVKTWWQILELQGDVITFNDAEQAYKRLRSLNHPDKGGTPEAFKAVQDAWEQARRELS